MIVSLDQNEICTALIEFIGNQGYPVADKQVEVTLHAGRGANGHTAKLEFSDKVSGTPAEVPRVDVDEAQQAIKFEFQDIDND